mmetsp:Transcript_20728/g.45542  ORF Transcript_20728/g.45542 Transcript_20728/m.45542 type:complete len:673 (-) Transcript_20728:101-2119(-)
MADDEVPSDEAPRMEREAAAETVGTPVSGAEDPSLEAAKAPAGSEVPEVAEAEVSEAERKKALGNVAFQAKKYAEAAALYGEAIDAAGDDASPVYFSNRAVCRASLSDWAGAREDAAEALRRPGGATKKAFFQKVRADVRLGHMEEAQATLQLADEHGLRADVEKLLGEDGLALAAATAASRKAAAATNGSSEKPAEAAAPADRATLAKEAGTARYKEGAYREALSEYRRALDLLPTGDTDRRAPLLGNVAAACLMLRRISECVSACEEALELDAGNSKIRARLATAQVALGEFSGARATLGDVSGDAALENASRFIDETEQSLAAADQALASGGPAKALGLYADLETKAMFSCPALALRMGRCYLELKNFPRVLNATQQVLRANPRNIDALLLRSEALFKNNSATLDSQTWVEPLEQGQKLLKEALSFDPDHAGAQAFRKRLRLLCTKHGELKEAFTSREFEQARDIIDLMAIECQESPISLASLYCERAKVNVRLKDWRAVLKDVGQATYRNHELVQPYLYRAQALQQLDRHEDAVKELEGLFAWHREQSTYDKLQEAKFLLRKKNRANYYELIGVPSIASQLEIKKGYRERAAEWHPDKKGHLDDVAKKNAEEMFKRIGEAYEVLTDPAKKELYDKGYDLEGIEEQIEIKKRRTEQSGCGGCRPGGCGR